MTGQRELTHTVNGEKVTRLVAPRMLLSDYLRHELDLYGTRVGCEQGVCGACTVLLNGDAVRSCLILAAQTQGDDIETVEALGTDVEALHPLQQAFHETHALQCGFCTSGFLMTLAAHQEVLDELTEPEIREFLSGNICRCTGYEGIVDAVCRAAQGREDRC